MRCRFLLMLFAPAIVAAAPAGNSGAAATGAAPVSPAGPPHETRAETASPSTAPTAAGSHAPCQADEDDRQSALCASWRSVDVSRDAVRLSLWQMVISALGLGGLLYSLHLNRKATNAAARATADTERSLAIAERNAEAAAELVRVSQLNAERELRCYLDFKNISLISNNLEDTEDEACVAIQMQIYNFGRTPASNVALTYAFFSVPRIGGKRTLMERDVMKIGMIAQSDDCFGKHWMLLKKEMLEKISTNSIFMELVLKVQYTDIFGKKHSLSSEYESSDKQQFPALEGTRVST